MAMIYSIKCSVCGKELVLMDASLDTDFDLSIEVEPCQDCIDTAVEEAVTEAEDALGYPRNE